MLARAARSNVAAATERSARSVVQSLGDGVIIFLWSDLAPNWLVPAATAHRDDTREVLLRELAAMPVRVSSTAQGRALHATQPMILSPRDDAGRSLGPAVASIASSLGSVLLASIPGKRGPLGVLFVERDRGEPTFGAQDSVLVTSLAASLARNVEMALEATGPEDEGALDVARAVDDLASALSIANTLETVAAVTVSVLARTFDARLVEITLADPTPAIVATNRPDVDAPPASHSAAAAVIVGGDAVFDGSRTSWKRFFPREAVLVAEAGSLACVPLLAADRCCGALTVVGATDGIFARETRSLMLTMAKHVALALERAKLAGAEHEAQRRWALLAETGKAMGSLETASIADAVCRILVPTFADGCAVDLAVDGALLRLATVGGGFADPGLGPVRSPRLLRSAFVAREQTLGALVATRAVDRPAFVAEDHALFDELAHRCALAFDNARLYEQTRRAVTARDEFLAIAGHELRTPLSTLNMFVWSLLGPEKIVTRTTQEDLALRQISRLDRLVDQLLDVARLTSGRLDMDLEPVHLAELVDRVVADLGAQVEEQPAISLDVDASIIGEWDLGRVEQILINLVSNAMRYGGGSPISIRASREGEGVRIAVRDHGPGMDQPTCARVFEREARVTSKRPNEGLGIGLWITRQLVEAHGGRIALTSRVGEGVEVVVTLPLAPPPQEPRAAAPAAPTGA